MMLRQTWILALSSEDEPGLTKELMVSLLQGLDGVRRLEHATVRTNSTGEFRADSLIDVYFDNEDAMNAAFASPEGRRISRELMSKPSAILDVLTMDVD